MYWAARPGAGHALDFGGPFKTAHVVPQKTVVGQVGKFHSNGGWPSLFLEPSGPGDLSTVLIDLQHSPTKLLTI